MEFFKDDGALAPLPRELIFYINTICNASCKMCDVGLRNRNSTFYKQLAGNSESELSVDSFERVIKEVKKDQPVININGLEPLLHSRIIDLVKVAKSHNLYTKVVTNGILLPDYAKYLIESDVDLVIVSLDGSAEIHDNIRGSGVFEKAFEGIRLLIKWREKTGKQIKIGINYCISNLNYHCLLKFAKLMIEQEKIDFIRLAHLTFVTEQLSQIHNQHYSALGLATACGSTDLARVDADVLGKQIKLLRKNYGKQKIILSYDLSSRKKLTDYYYHPEQIVTRKQCITPWTSSTITANGDVIIRNRCFQFVAGNVNERSFTEIWNGERYQTFRRALKKVGLFPVCNRCCGTFW